jgi:hypothetical protein
MSEERTRKESPSDPVVPAGWRSFRPEELPGWLGVAGLPTEEQAVDEAAAASELDLVVDRLTPLVDEIGAAEEEHDASHLLTRIERLLSAARKPEPPPG